MKCSISECGGKVTHCCPVQGGEWKLVCDSHASTWHDGEPCPLSIKLPSVPDSHFP